MRHLFRAAFKKTPRSMRVAMGFRWRTIARVQRLLISERAVDDLLGRTNLFFILGSGRCGTMLLSSFLNKAPEALVLHEPRRMMDMAVRAEARRDPDFAREYVRLYRKYEIYKKIREKSRESSCSTYGEVSQPLRCLGRALREEIPGTRFMILVRDGRATVRSAINRQLNREFAPAKRRTPISPLPGDAYLEQWDRMTDFEKFCWWWQDSYRMLLDHLPDAPILHFERIVQDFEYVKSNILDPLGLDLTQADWEAHIDRKTGNSATTYRVEHWSEWTPDRWEAFERICGPMMRRLGYEAEAPVPRGEAIQAD